MHVCECIHLNSRWRNLYEYRQNSQHVSICEWDLKTHVNASISKFNSEQQQVLFPRFFDQMQTIDNIIRSK